MGVAGIYDMDIYAACTEHPFKLRREGFTLAHAAGMLFSCPSSRRVVGSYANY